MSGISATPSWPALTPTPKPLSDSLRGTPDRREVWPRVLDLCFASMRPQPLISVTDVGRSSRFYQELLGCESGHGGDEYERLVREDTLVLQLHAFEIEHHHGRIGDPSARPYGNGVALWFEVDDFDAAAGRARTLEAEIVLAPHRNPPDGPGGPAIASCGCATPTAT